MTIAKIETQVPTDERLELCTARFKGFFARRENQTPLSRHHDNVLAHSMFGATADTLQSGIDLTHPLDLTPASPPVSSSYKIEFNSMFEAPGLPNDYYNTPLQMQGSFLVIGLANHCYVKNTKSEAVHKTKTLTQNTTAVTAIGVNKEIVIQSHKDGECVVTDLTTLSPIEVKRTKSINKLLLHENIFCFLGQKFLTVADVKNNKNVLNIESTVDYAGVNYNPDTYNLVLTHINGVDIYDIRKLAESDKPVFNLPHKLPGKGIAFHEHLLATGGGRNDRQLMIWDIRTGEMKTKLDMHAQICDLYWDDDQSITATLGLFDPGIAVCSYKNSILTEQVYMKTADRALFSARNPQDLNELAVAYNEKVNFFSLQLPPKKEKYAEKQDFLSLELR